MKVKLSTHTFLVQVSKLQPYFSSGVGEWTSKRTLATEIMDILRTLPNIEKVDYSEIAEYHRRHTRIPLLLNWSDFETYYYRFYIHIPSEITERLLLNMLEVVPNGEMLLEMDNEERSLLNASVFSANRFRITNPQILLIYSDLAYNTFAVVEE